MRNISFFLLIFLLFSCVGKRENDLINEITRLKSENEIMNTVLDENNKKIENLERKIMDYETSAPLSRISSDASDSFIFLEGDSMFPFGYIFIVGYTEEVEVFHPIEEVMVTRTIFVITDKKSSAYEIFSSDKFISKKAFVYSEQEKIGLFIDKDEVSGFLLEELNNSSNTNPVKIIGFLKETILGGGMDFWPYLLPISVIK